jgi:hypothetical protein
MGQGYPLTGPSPGANPLINPSSLPLESGNPFSNIFPKRHGVFFSPLFVTDNVPPTTIVIITYRVVSE